MQLPEFQNEPFTDFSLPANRDAFKRALAEVEGQLGKTWPAWIGGEQITDKPELVSRDPGNLDRVIGTYQKLDAEDATRAVDAAHAAFPAWSQTTVEERVGHFLKAVEKMREQKHLLSALMVFEEGKSWPEADGETAEAIDFIEYYARQALKLAEPQPVTPLPGEENRMIYIPLGVGVVIPPWNFPLAITIGMASAALLAGNTVVLKPASQSPGVAVRWVQLMYDVGLPREVLNLVTGPGAIAGAALVEHPKTRFISFTGSREVGLEIFEKSAKTQPGQIWMKRLVAEMGGKDGILVDAECNLDAAVDAVVASAFGYQGQKCSACSRAMIHQDVYDEFVSKLIPKVEAIPQGHPSDQKVFLGPVIDAGAKKKILSYIEIGKQEGDLLAGGGEGKGNGYYVEPTVFGNIAPDARLAQEEVFGPVLALIKVKDFDHGLEVANNTEYGLTGSVYTDNPKHKEAAVRGFHVGNCYINRKCTGALVGVHPFGGFNMSGTDSKAGGPDYLLQFLQAKTISEKVG